MNAEILDPLTTTIVRGFRERRAAAGLRCPRCDSHRVVRWGQSSGRQRYRCRGCGRCFSDLTETPLSYLKRLDAWPSYLRCLTGSMTIRRSAQVAGISVATAFRWRHLILEAGDLPDQRKLCGLVEFATASLPYSEKGSRPGKAPPWTPGMYYGWLPIYPRPGCGIIVARDRHGRQREEWINTRTLTGAQLRALFDEGLSEDSTILCNSGRFGPFGQLRFTRDGGERRLIRVSGAAGWRLERFHNLNARAWLGSFGHWIRRFHGIATKYVPNYLAWRKKLDLIGDALWLDALWAYVAGVPLPTVHANRGGRESG